MTPEQTGLLLLMFLCVLAIIAIIVWFVSSVANDQKKKTETVRRGKQDAIDQVIRDSRLGAQRIWSHDDSVVTHLGNGEGIPKGIQATSIKISEQDRVLRICQCYYADISNVWDTHSGCFKGEPSTIAEIDFDDLLSAEISVNEEHTDFQTGKIEGKAKNALIGTLLFGVAGGVVGSAGERRTSSTTKSTKKITSLAIEISTTNTAMPWMFIYFYSAIHTIQTAFSDTPLGMTEDGIRELPEFKQMRKWYSSLQANISSPRRHKFQASPDISIQLEKLAELHQKERLTDEEYRSAKQKLLDL